MSNATDPARWPWAPILFACLALLALSVAIGFVTAPEPECATDAECEALISPR